MKCLLVLLVLLLALPVGAQDVKYYGTVLGQAPAALARYTNLYNISLGLYAYWNMDEANGARVKTSGSGVGADLAESGGVVGSAAGKFVNATSTTEADATALLGTITAADLMHGFTFACWYYPASGYNANNSSLMAIWDGVGAYVGGNNYISLNRFFDSAYLDVSGPLITGGTILAPGNKAGPVTLDAWHFVMLTVDPATKTMTVDIDDGSIVKTTPPWTGDITALSPDTISLGGKWATLDTWRGRIDEPMLFQRLLTSGERHQLYVKTAAGIP